MSIENVKLFMAKMKSDAELAERVKTLGNREPAEQVSELARIAGEHGYEFSVDEYQECLRQELSEEQLEKVAGGFYVDFSNIFD